jgi:hypothetical protein
MPRVGMNKTGGPVLADLVNLRPDRIYRLFHQFYG